ncbi:MULTISPECIES: Uma2 family endonuclease [Chitinophagaceae]|uniref:Uma2 family endonuclease n=1 Tax=Chitinophagaceae TaxID=563835 RepID=UPI000DEF54E0|nr:MULTISPECIES: Uma2 family endonuclease [Chitinophagaceae]RPD46588.1 Uma2 family endonuclease [Paracnuella aquatica]
MSAVPATKYITVEAYLLQEETASEKHEYFGGEVFAMSGGSINHNTISVNMIGEINAFLKGKNCQVFNSDQKIHIESNGLFTYPDISIVCDGIKRFENRNDVITNPSVIIEVLSPSTSGYDRGQKFKLYRDIPSLKEYILISSTEMLVEQYSKQSEHIWSFRETKDSSASLQIETIGFSCPLDEVFRNVAFE